MALPLRVREVRNYRRKPRVEDGDLEDSVRPLGPRAPPSPSRDSLIHSGLLMRSADGAIGHERENMEGAFHRGSDDGGGGGGAKAEVWPDAAAGQGPLGGADADSKDSQPQIRAMPTTGVQKNDLRLAKGIGYNMLKSMGWTENTGLGQSSNGIMDPILPKVKPNHMGLGYNPAAAQEAAQEKIREMQKAVRDLREQKLRLKLERAEAAEEEAKFMRESYVAAADVSHERSTKSDADLQETSSDLHRRSNSISEHGQRSTQPGQCPHCRQRFDTNHGLKSHINSRHAKLLASKRHFKRERRQSSRRGGGASRWTTSSARSLAPMSQNLSVYD